MGKGMVSGRDGTVTMFERVFFIRYSFPHSKTMFDTNPFFFFQENDSFTFIGIGRQVEHLLISAFIEILFP